LRPIWPWSDRKICDLNGAWSAPKPSSNSKKVAELLGMVPTPIDGAA
jgi:hypothetical protein